MWWPDTLHAHLAADGLRLCAVDPLGRARSSDGLVAVAAEPSASWRPWVEALSAWIAARPGRRFDLRVVLSDRFVRYQLLPWRPGIGSQAEWRAYAGHRLRDVFGDLAAEWTVLVAPTPPGDTALVGCVDTALLEALRALAPRPGRLSSVQPRFAAGYNHWRRRLKGRPCWFGVVEAERACIGLLDRGRWRILRNETCDLASPQGLDLLLNRLDLTMDAPAPATPVFLAGELAAPAPLQLADRPLHALALPARLGPGQRQLALARGL